MFEKNPRTARLKPLGACLAVIALFLVLRHVPYVGATMNRGAGAVSQMGTAVGRALGRFLASEDSLSAMLSLCTEDRALLARDAVEFERLRDENEELRALLAYKEETGAAGITARIIARSLPEDAMRVLLDKGSRAGVTLGATAVIGQGVVFGSVTHVDDETSVVTLLTSAESRIPAAILGKKRTIGLVEGRDGAVLSMNFIPRDADVVRGDVVITSGLEGRIPEGLLLGTVTEVVDMASAPFEEALLEPLGDPLEWSLVLILPPVVK